MRLILAIGSGCMITSIYCQPNLCSQEYPGFVTELHGELWIASANKGYNRYDGLDTRHYLLSDPTSGLQGSFIQSALFEDFEGRYWTSTYEQLCYFDPKKDQFTCFQLVVSNDTITQSYHVFDYDDNKYLLYLRADSLLLTYDVGKNSIHQIFGSTTGNRFLRSGDQIVASPWENAFGFEIWSDILDQPKKKRIDFKGCKSFSGIKVIKAFVSNGNYYLVTSLGVIKYNANVPCASEAFEYKVAPMAISCATQKDNYLLLGVKDYGIVAFNVNSHTYIETGLGKDAYLEDIYCGNEDVLIYFDAKKGYVQTSLRNVFYKDQAKIGRWDMVQSKYGLRLLVDQDHEVCVSDGQVTYSLYIGLPPINGAKVEGAELISPDQVLLYTIYGIYLWKAGNTAPQTVIVGTKDKINAIRRSNKKIKYIANFKLYEGHLAHKAFDKPLPEFGDDLSDIIYFDDSLVVCFSTASKVIKHQGGHPQVRDIGYHLMDGVYDPERGYCYVNSVNGILMLDKDLDPTLLTDVHPYLVGRKISGLISQEDKLYFAADHLIGQLDKESMELVFFDPMMGDVVPIFTVSDTTLTFANQAVYQVPLSKAFGYKEPTNIMLKRFAVDGYDDEDVTLSHWGLGHNQNNLKFYVAPTSWHRVKNTMLKYRLKPRASIWQYKDISEPVRFEYLPSGYYTLEMQALYPDGGLSDTKELTFTIHPIWYNSWWFRVSMAIGFGLAFFLFYKTRVSRLKKEFELQQTIDQLQRSALAAQMNPHFIFNCLNSIQQFIMSNDKYNAMEYLSSFAKLIRMYLQASVTNDITIEDEIRCLRIYMELEQLRFSQSFDFDIICSDSFPAHLYKIPPMLLQPFVENAILHGMKAKAKGEGHIDIGLSLENSHLRVQIKDNGPGIDPSSKPKEGHKSLGVGITQQRLQYIQTGAGADYDLVVDSDSSGTRVSLSIPVERINDIRP